MICSRSLNCLPWFRLGFNLSEKQRKRTKDGKCMSYRSRVEVELNLWQGSTRLLILVPHIKPSLPCSFIDLQYKAIYVGKKVCQVSWSLYSFKAILDHGHSKSSLTWKDKNKNCITLWYNRIIVDNCIVLIIPYLPNSRLFVQTNSFIKIHFLFQKIKFL